MGKPLCFHRQRLLYCKVEIERTWRIETSQQPEEKKIRIFVSLCISFLFFLFPYGNQNLRIWNALQKTTIAFPQQWRAKREQSKPVHLCTGVVGFLRRFTGTCTRLSSRRRLECPTIERKSRVNERFVYHIGKRPEQGRTREILFEPGRTTKTITSVMALPRLNTTIDRQ